MKKIIGIIIASILLSNCVSVGYHQRKLQEEREKATAYQFPGSRKDYQNFIDHGGSGHPVIGEPLK